MTHWQTSTDPRDPAVRAKMRRTAWWLSLVIAALFAGAACYIAFNGHKSRTVLHSESSFLTARIAA